MDDTDTMIASTVFDQAYTGDNVELITPSYYAYILLEKFNGADNHEDWIYKETKLLHVQLE